MALISESGNEYRMTIPDVCSLATSSSLIEPDAQFHEDPFRASKPARRTGRQPARIVIMSTPSSLVCAPRQFVAALALVAAFGVAALAPAAAQANEDLSAASSLALSLPMAIVASAPAVVLSAGVQLTVVAVTASATGTVWVLERASDGARIVLRLSGDLARGASIGVGAALSVTALSAGWLLVASGEALCFVPNELGVGLLHNRRLTY
jgi:hypothetical protein